MQISKIQQPPIFALKLQISIKSDFPNRFFNFLQECVQEVVYFDAYMQAVLKFFASYEHNFSSCAFLLKIRMNFASKTLKMHKKERQSNKDSSVY